MAQSVSSSIGTIPAKDLSEKQAAVETNGLSLDLDSGADNVRTRNHFWQLWCVVYPIRYSKDTSLTSHRIPKDPPPSPLTNIDNSPVRRRIVVQR